jgi:hypothetical protein
VKYAPPQRLINTSPLLAPRASARTVPVESLIAGALVLMIVVVALPAFMLRATGVMDDSVFWVVGKALDSGRVLYRNVFFTQPPLFVLIPQAAWFLSDDILVHRAFLLSMWLANAGLFYLALDRLRPNPRLLITGLFLVSSFVAQSYELQTETFIVTASLIALLAVVKRPAAAGFVVGMATSVSLLIKPVGPLAFLPCLYYVLFVQRRQWSQVALGALVPAAVAAVYLLGQGTMLEFWEQVVVDNGKVGLLLNDDWVGYLSLAVAPLILPLFVLLVMLDRRPSHLEWWISITVFLLLLGLELLRGGRHYALFNLCVLAWMTVRAQPKLNWSAWPGRAGLVTCALLAAGVQVITITRILARGSIGDELAAAQFVHELQPGSLQVFANDSPRIYMLLNSLQPAYPYLFVYDTNKDILTWDTYMSMIEQTPPDYIAVEGKFVAVEYGQQHSSVLVNAQAVKHWIEDTGGYRRMDVGQNLDLTVYRHETPERSN